MKCFVFCRDTHIMPWLVFEYMEHGDLSEILRANSGIFSQTPPSDSAALKEGTGPPKVGLVSQIIVKLTKSIHSLSIEMSRTIDKPYNKSP